MSTLTLTFKIPEEADEAERAVHGGDWYAAMCELDSRLRSMVKYDTGHTKEFREGVGWGREQLGDVLATCNLQLYK